MWVIKPELDQKGCHMQIPFFAKRSNVWSKSNILAPPLKCQFWWVHLKQLDHYERGSKSENCHTLWIFRVSLLAGDNDDDDNDDDDDDVDGGNKGNDSNFNVIVRNIRQFQKMQQPIAIREKYVLILTLSRTLLHTHALAHTPHTLSLSSPFPEHNLNFLISTHNNIWKN